MCWIEKFSPTNDWSRQGMLAMDQPVLMQLVKISDIFLGYEMFLPPPPTPEPAESHLWISLEDGGGYY